MKSKFDPQNTPSGHLHHRRSIRLKGYDYSSEGAYFVTLVTQGREHVFGQIVDEEMIPNEAGKMIIKWWNELPNKFSNVILGEFVVMPNHFHGIIFIVYPVGADLRVSPDDQEKGGHIGPPQRASPPQRVDPPPRAPLSRMIQWFKTMTTNEYIRGVKGSNWKPFDGRFWQRNYHEHIIRNEKDLQQKTDYIFANPSRWDEDDENPLRSM